MAMGRTDRETIKYLIETTWLLMAIVNMFYQQAFLTRNCNIRQYLAISDIGMSEFGEYFYLCGS